MSNVLAGIGRGQMEVLPERIKQRRTHFERYKTWFEKWNAAGFDIRFQEEINGIFSNRWLTAILVDPKTNKNLTRETIRLALAEENIEARPLWKPMHLQPVFENYPFYGDGTSERLFDHGLCLPSGSNLVDGDFERIFEVLEGVFSGLM
jgi:dTDP-4-amino-4,6-dideoxygalactose transaminase